jgi:hypothetical protein
MGLLDAPRGAAVWATGRGELRCWSPLPGICVVKLTGHLEKELAPKFAEDFNRTHPGQLLAIFFDGGDMHGYDSKFRIGMQDWAKGVKQRTGSLHVWVQSKLVQMGVAVANLALGGVLRVHATRAAMEATARAVAEKTA